MAIRPDWMTGTLNLVAGTPDFTTTGSALQTAAIQAGDAIITATGYVLIIAEITGQNSGRLFDNCPVAAAGAGQPLRVRYQPDGSRVQAAVRMMRDLLTTGNLEAFAALVGEEDAVPVFVGPGVMKLVPKSEFGPDDTKGNLAALAALENIANLTELAAIAKANDQFVVMGADGTITLKSIESVTDAIAEKYKLPAGGTVDQLLDATGAAISKAGLPISEAAQKALGTKSSYNWIINGDFTINQRGGVKKPANGVYGFDRWKGHAGGIEQIIEALPAGEYTLTWSGGGAGSFGGQTKASPIKATVVAGNASVVVPATATKVSVVHGDASASDPWSKCVRPSAEEERLCYRFFYRITGSENWLAVAATGAAGAKAFVYLSIPEKMRTSPSSTVYGNASYFTGGWINSTLLVDGVIGTHVICTVNVQSIQNPDGSPSWLVRLSNSSGAASIIDLDAEF
ncbi:hypothetical protein K1X45_02570 [Pseudochrobactrum sp. Wa41.01b-1]|uniref:hypothetical protein n=1 Tax=Pseudochrobactrum sp. Wa41.01b-1 TaxID=2864102 RepID=UPI001C690263|nr:hypothetical protein [Pseudochrobactrum sp. Wa41.01b-1]QYM73344.1 hypothetical protein K1X45_02570 [Pseudochrobactrum sp. Wa41.01b-1]